MKKQAIDYDFIKKLDWVLFNKDNFISYYKDEEYMFYLFEREWVIVLEVHHRIEKGGNYSHSVNFYYKSIRMHRFFNTLNYNELRKKAKEYKLLQKTHAERILSE